MRGDDFRFFVPLGGMVKAKNDRGEEVMRLRGVASTGMRDEDEETLDPSGFELDYARKFGYINWNHSKSAGGIIGEPVKLDINDRNELEIEADLFPDNEEAVKAYNLAVTLEKRRKSGKSKRQLGWSIEGKKLATAPGDNSRILRAMVTNIALTPAPKNAGTWAEVVKGVTRNDDYEYETVDQVDVGSPANGGQVYIIDVTNSDGDRITVDKNLNIKVVKKALTASSPSGAALGKEDLEGGVKYPGQVAKALENVALYEIKHGLPVAVKRVLREKFGKHAGND